MEYNNAELQKPSLQKTATQDILTDVFSKPPSPGSSAPPTAPPISHTASSIPHNAPHTAPPISHTAPPTAPPIPHNAPPISHTAPPTAPPIPPTAPPTAPPIAAAPPAVVLPATPVSPSPEEVYAVPIQRYPDFQLSASQNTSTVESDHVTSGNAKEISVPGAGSGDLISEAWSLSCDMTIAWQKENKVTSPNVPDIIPNSKVVRSVPVSKDLIENPQNCVSHESEVQQEAPETIPVTVVEIPVKDCEIVDNFNENMNSLDQNNSHPSSQKHSRSQSEQNGHESHKHQLNIESSKNNHVGLSPPSSVEDIENQDSSVHAETDSSAKGVDALSSSSKINQTPDTTKKADDGMSNIDNANSPKSSGEVETPEAKRKRIRSGDSPSCSIPARGADSSERPQRKRKLPQKLCDDNVINHTRETSFILKEHSKSQDSSRSEPAAKLSTTEAEDAEAERLKQLKVKQFQRLYVMSQRGYIPENPESSNTEEVEESLPVSPPESPEAASPRRTFSLMDIGISLNAKGEVTLSMPDDIKMLAKSGGSININFDMDCLDEDNCLKFKVTEDKEAITSALGTNDNNDTPLIESESSSEPERSDSPKIKIEPEEAVESSQSTRTKFSAPSRDSSVQVDLNVTTNEEDYLTERLMRASTASGFVSFPRFTNVTGSSLATVHKVLKNVKKGLSIDKFTKKPTWFCSLCNLTGDYGDMGPLFGPFDIYVPPKNSYRNKNMSEGAKNLFEKLSSTFNKDMTFSDDNEITVEREEVWLHEDCICWSPGVYMIGFDIYGLEEIFKVARFTVCSVCGDIGASLGCFKEGCSNRYHYRCAIKAKCKLIKSTFTVLCPTHSYGVVDNCLAVKPLMKVRNYLSQEEINESEELLSRRPGEEAREVAVKITKTRIIRSRKIKKTKKKKSEHVVGRKSVGGKQETLEEGTPDKPRRSRKFVEEEDEREVEDNDDEDGASDRKRERHCAHQVKIREVSSGRKRGRPRKKDISPNGTSTQIKDSSLNGKSTQRKASSVNDAKSQQAEDKEHIETSDVSADQNNCKWEMSADPIREKRVECPKCGYRLRSSFPHKLRLDMFYHIRKSHCPNKCFRQRQACETCNYLLELADNSIKDTPGRSPQFNYPCYACQKNFTRCIALSDHLSTHPQSPQHRKDHITKMLEHLDEIPATVKPCFSCGVFYLEKQFWVHIKVHSPGCREKHELTKSQLPKNKGLKKISDSGPVVVEQTG